MDLASRHARPMPHRRWRARLIVVLQADGSKRRCVHKPCCFLLLFEAAGCPTASFTDRYLLFTAGTHFCGHLRLLGLLQQQAFPAS
uniref:Secreted protein n=1 Tax=Ascaris lumbricoides TaxID=6252 RepID=A0A0M3I6N7_ASCLU